VGEDWSASEVELIVADYFDMLRAELLSQNFNKAAHRRSLLSKLNGRSDQSVEFKHANISAVLVNMQQPYIDGYKPRGNYQRLLEERVESFLDARPSFFAYLVESPVLNPQHSPELPLVSIDQVFVAPPERVHPAQPRHIPVRRPQKIDFARRDAENRKLGQLGERFVLDVEKQRLVSHRRDDLARRVEWLSSTQGDGLGFDILSFNHDDDSERHVEVKTTPLGKFFPFYVTATEVLTSERDADHYHLYRVFSFSNAPKLYVLRGALSSVCTLDPVQYKAYVG